MAHGLDTKEGKVVFEDRFFMVVEGEEGEAGGKFAIHFTDAERLKLDSLVKKGSKAVVNGKGLCCIYVPDMETHTGYQGYVYPGHFNLLTDTTKEKQEGKEGKESRSSKKAQDVKEAEGNKDTSDPEEP